MVALSSVSEMRPTLQERGVPKGCERDPGSGHLWTSLKNRVLHTSTYLIYYSGIRIFESDKFKHQDLMDRVYFGYIIKVLLIFESDGFMRDANIRIPLYYIVVVPIDIFLR